MVDEQYQTVNPYIVADESGHPDWEPASFDVGAPYHCPKCGGTLFECVRSDAYETSLRCPTCRIQFLVHDG